MDADLKEALNAIKLLRAELWLAFETMDHISDEAQNALDEGEKILRKHNDPDDMMDVENPHS